jgi:hypothetical protein
MTRRGQEFEEFVSDTFQRLCAPPLVLNCNDRILGLKSRIPRQIDLSIRNSQGLLIVDAKDFSRPININIVDQLLGVANDVDSNQAAMVAANGYTRGAKSRAETERVYLFTVIDPSGKHRWRQPFTADSLLIVTLLEEARLTFSDASEYFERNRYATPFCLELYDHQYCFQGRVHDFLFGPIDLPIMDGMLLNHPLFEHTVLVKDRQSTGGFREIMLTATLKVRTEAWLGSQQLLEGRGLFNEISKQATLSIYDSFFEPVDISTLRYNQNWKRVEHTPALMCSKAILGFTAINQTLCPLTHACSEH